MSKIFRSAVVPYSCKEMYELINDVDAYQDFLPWCEYSTVDRQNPDGSVHATLGVAHKGFRLQFATVNQGKPFEELSMRLSEGAFKHLGGEWKLTPLGDEGCRVELDFEYEFSNIIYEKLLNQFFDRIAETLMDAFLERAKVRYG